MIKYKKHIQSAAKAKQGRQSCLPEPKEGRMGGVRAAENQIQSVGADASESWNTVK